MQPYTRLFIDGVSVDLESIKDLPISFVLRISDPEGGISGSNSKRNITIPPTKTNLNVFALWYKNYVDDPAAAQFKPFYIESNGSQVLSGQAQLQEFTGNSNRYGRGAKEVKVALFADNADWIVQINDLLLRDLDWTDTDRNFDGSNVVAGWDASVDGGEKIAFPLVKWKEWNTPGEVDKSEFTPAIFMLDILNKIFNSVGYTLLGNFINTDVFKSLIMLTPTGDRYNANFSEDFLNIQADLATAIIRNPVTSEIYTAAIPYDNVINDTLPPSPYVPATGVYTAPYDGFYDLDFSIVLTDITNVAGAFMSALAIDVFVNGVLYPPTTEFNWATIDFADLPFTASGTRVVEVEAADTIEVYVIAVNSVPVTHYEFTQGNLSITGEAAAGFGRPLLFEYLLQDWKASELVLAIKNIYNLKFETDVDKQTVTIEPRNDYFYSERLPVELAETRTGFYTSSFDFDYSQKVDLSKASRIIARNDRDQIQSRRWETEGDTENVINAGQALLLYAATFDLGANRFKDKTADIVVPFFAATIHTLDSEISEADLPPVLVPLIYPQNYLDDPTATAADYEVTPRILHFYGQRGLDGSINVTTNGLTVLPACFFVNYNDPTGLDPSLAFGQQLVSENAESIGLLRRFFLAELASWSKGKDLQEFIFWDMLDILSLSFRNMITLEAAEFIVEEINGYNPILSKSIKTKLTLNYPPTQADADAIISAVVRGMANLV